MASWTYQNGVFRPVPTPLRPTAATVPPSTASAATDALSASSSFQVFGEVTSGEFVEVASTFAPTDAALQPTPSLTLATHRSPVVVGVVTETHVGNQASVKTHGVAYAWVVPGDYTPPLSGYYAKAVNGVHQCRVVIDVQGDAFTIAATKDDEVEQLTARFDALTTPP